MASSYSIEVPSSAKPGFTPIYRNAVFPEVHSTSTLYDVFNRTLARKPDSPFVGCRPWDFATGAQANSFEWITYAQADEQRTALGSALSQLAKEKKLGQEIHVDSKEWCMSFWALNRPEFQIVHQACNAYSRRLVCIYDSYDVNNAAYIINHSESHVIFTTSSHIQQVLERKTELPLLKAIVILDKEAPSPSGGTGAKLPRGQVGLDRVALQWASEKGLLFYRYDDFLSYGREHLHAHTPSTDPNTVAMYCYTSGTTGTPKGAIITTGGLAYAAKSAALGTIGLDTMIGYLPIAHIFEVLAETTVIESGGRVGYFSGDPLKLVEDCQVLQPTIFPSVPRVLNRIAALIQEQMAGDSFKAKLLRRAVESKVAYHDMDGSVTHAFWDRLIFNKVKMILGGKVANICSGSAPLRPEVLKLLRVAFCVDLRNGYGQTENSVCTSMAPNDKDTASVGPPSAGVEVRLVDCPQLNYYTTDKPWPRGELLMRGGVLFQGYFKDEAKTREALDEEGWLHSGDIAAVDEKGRIHIVDRVKNVLKLSQGEYVALENVEQMYTGLEFLAQIWVHGDSLQDYLIAVAVPEPGAFARYASHVLGRTVSSSPSDLALACADPKVVTSVLRDLVRLGRQRGLNGVEMLRGLHLTPEMFSVENGLITPTFKMKRPEAAKYFEKEVKALYDKGAVDIRPLL
ncbi:acetyl-CoA synthetase-like protein [Tilletiaria anomala UBC 951]|uniref:Acetyl-CoA synthetase-like protein n=1 Tax=Tilletiaria anomala (strain ATCC 24038 / CBS 436.72 / UBC 951) TaxID=1037660 RepID=A0A066VFL0_TILAU|nr:acetyl-CoA synthetase-like protein [Tilletiaria anomala UBC 951]KDN40256.1 acetyl-CoA synthetase-like protein [Tilletiaria anomala UBC 951]